VARGAGNDAATKGFVGCSLLGTELSDLFAVRSNLSVITSLLALVVVQHSGLLGAGTRQLVLLVVLSTKQLVYRSFFGLQFFLQLGNLLQCVLQLVLDGGAVFLLVHEVAEVFAGCQHLKCAWSAVDIHRLHVTCQVGALLVDFGLGLGNLLLQTGLLSLVVVYGCLQTVNLGLQLVDGILVAGGLGLQTLHHAARVGVLGVQGVDLVLVAVCQHHRSARQKSTADQYCARYGEQADSEFSRDKLRDFCFHSFCF